MRRERRMNPKCQTGPTFDTFSARSAHLTGLKMRRITRGEFIALVGGAAAWPPAPRLKGRYSNRLNRIPRKLDPLLPAQQLQQYQHPLARTQHGKHADLLTQRTIDRPHPRARPEPARLYQLDQPVALAGSDLADHR